MSEEVTRAVGGKGVTTINIAGKACTTRPLNLRELGEIERECLKQYRRSYLEAYTENADMLPPDIRLQTIQDKMEIVARWDIKDLPLKDVYEQGSIQITETLRDWLYERYSAYLVPSAGDAGKAPISTESPKRLAMFRGLTVTALETGALSEAEYTAMTGNVRLLKLRVGYVNWWISGTMAGMFEMVYHALKHNGITREQVAEAIGQNEGLMSSLQREIEGLSTPAVGNT